MPYTEEQKRQIQEAIDQAEREAASGGGFIGHVNYSLGYKVFAQGLSNEDTWFAYDVLQDGSKEAALNKARALIAEHNVMDSQGRTARPQSAICFHVPLAGLKLGGDNWNVDQYFVTPIYYDAYTQILRSTIKELGIWPGWFWGRFAWTAEPSGRTRFNQEGEEVAVLVAVPVEVYETEEEAETAAGGEGGGASQSTQAPPWLVEEVNNLMEMVNTGAPVEVIKNKTGLEHAEEFVTGDEAARVEVLMNAYSQSEAVVRAAFAAIGG